MFIFIVCLTFFVIFKLLLYLNYKRPITRSLFQMYSNFLQISPAGVILRYGASGILWSIPRLIEEYAA